MNNNSLLPAQHDVLNLGRALSIISQQFLHVLIFVEICFVARVEARFTSE